MIQSDFNGTISVKSSIMARRYTIKVGLTETEITKDLLWTTQITIAHKNLRYFTATLRKCNYSNMVCMRCCNLSCCQTTASISLSIHSLQNNRGLHHYLGRRDSSCTRLRVGLRVWARAARIVSSSCARNLTPLALLSRCLSPPRGIKGYRQIQCWR